MHSVFQRLASNTVNIPGTAVYAKWNDRCLYPGSVQKREGQRYLVKFEDGGSLKVRVDDIVVCNLLPVGFDVMAQDGDGFFVKAVVVGTTEAGYDVELGKENVR